MAASLFLRDLPGCAGHIPAPLRGWRREASMAASAAAGTAAKCEALKQ